MLKKRGHSSAKILEDLRSDIEEPITAILSLNTVANTVGAAIAGAIVSKLYGDNSVIWFSGAFTLGILIFSEIIPKTVGVSFSITLSPYVAIPVRWMVICLKPIVWLCRFIIKLIPQNRDEDSISAEEIQTIAALSLKSGEIEPDQERVISNVLELQSKIVRQVMTPRTVTFSLDGHMTIGQAMTQFIKLSSHSRVPVYEIEPDNVTGIVMRKDVLLAAAQQKNSMKLISLMRPVHFVPETAPLNRILIDFFERQQHLFVVVDEYGSMTGIVSMEDILEEIVGREIIDESDSAKDMRELARKLTIESRKKDKKNT